MAQIDDDDISRQIAVRLKEIRTAKGLSQRALGEKVDKSYQQIQKYENSTSRITVGTLFNLSQALSVPIQNFFEPIEDKSAISSLDQQAYKLMREYKSIENERHREAVIQVVKAMKKSLNEVD